MTRARRRGHGEGSVHQRGDGRWVGVADLGWEGGKRKRKYCYGKTQAEAIEKLRRVQQAHAAGLPIVDERTTVGEYLDWWVAESLPGTVRRSTLTSYESKVRLHIVPVLGKVKLAKLAPSHVQQLMNSKIESGLSPRSVQYIHAVLRRALGQAERWGLVARNVARLVSPPKVTRAEITYLTPDEARRFLEATSDDRLSALYTVAVALGLRQGEALGLRWEDVDLDAARLRVRQQLQRIDGRFQFVPPKSASSRRSLPLPRVCVEALRAHRARQLTERLAAGDRWTDTGLVFATTKGAPIDARNLQRDFKRLCTQAGIAGLRFHDLRHTCATLLLAQGIPTRVVMEVLGHSQMALTTDTYQHVLPELKHDAARLIDDVLSAPASA